MQSAEFQQVRSIPLLAAPQALPPESVTECGERFVQLTDCKELHIDMQYIKQGIPGAVPECWMREGAYRRLMLAAAYLPDGLRFRIFDAWRPFCVQKALYDDYAAVYSKKHPELTGDALRAALIAFVSEPRRDRVCYPVHCSGGAVDLTIEDKTGTPLDFGTAFDCFDQPANTAYFEGSGNETVIRNRRLLYSVMTAAGFTNLPSEWWHYDFGTRFWGYYRGCPCRYEAVYTPEDVRAMC